MALRERWRVLHLPHHLGEPRMSGRCLCSDVKGWIDRLASGKGVHSRSPTGYGGHLGNEPSRPVGSSCRLLGPRVLRSLPSGKTELLAKDPDLIGGFEPQSDLVSLNAHDCDANAPVDE